MKTLVYFASGQYRKEYQSLDFDSIYLIDDCFNIGMHGSQNVSVIGKVKCIGMDCLESIEFLKNENIKIDCFVCLNEGMYEGGGRYAINSDMFLGYTMPLFNDEYIHIMNKNYYQNMFNVSMDLPYKIEEIEEADKNYISPFIFSKDDYHRGYAKVYHMTKSRNKQSFQFCSKINLTIIQDSIWNYSETLDSIFISFNEQGQRDFFEKLPKVKDKRQISMEEIFTDCVKNKTNKIGFTPWGHGNYDFLIEILKTYQEDYPKEIMLFHLNKLDYSRIKKKLAINLIAQ